MSFSQETAREAQLAIKFAAVGMMGFAVDAVLLKAGLSLHLGAAWARLISLTLAMQTTFVVNRTYVFRRSGREGLQRQWFAYMATNGVGNFCNYWIFVTLSSLHGRLISEPFVALTISAAVAFVINFAGARLVVFGREQLELRLPVTPLPKAPLPKSESLPLSPRANSDQTEPPGRRQFALDSKP